MKLCKDCRWFSLDGGYMLSPNNYIREYYVCRHKKSVNLVVGGFARCELMRNNLDLNVCGPEGKWFKEKEK